VGKSATFAIISAMGAAEGLDGVPLEESSGHNELGHGLDRGRFNNRDRAMGRVEVQRRDDE
jgi:hypothetical protein